MLGHRALNVDDYLGILKRRWWIIAIPALILPIVAFAITFFISPKYLSQTLVLIEVQKVPDSVVKPVISSDLDSRLASMKEQILSRSRIQPIIERYNLYGNQHMSMDDRIDEARASILIKPITSEIAHSSGLPGFFISFEAGDPHTAQLVCGEITSLFLGENLRSREASAEGTTDFLKSQLADAKRNLDQQDAKLAEFQRQNYGKLPGEESPNFNMFTSLNAQLEATTQDLARMEQAKSYEEALVSQQAPAPVAASTDAAPAAAPVGTPTEQMELQTLLTEEADLSAHYTADYPDVVAIHHKIAELRKRIAAEGPVGGGLSRTAAAPVRESPAVQQMRAQMHAMDQAIATKRKEQADIQANIHMYQERIQSSPEIAAQFKSLTRDYQTAQTFYDDLLTKMNQSKMATDLEKRQEGEQFRVMDEPNLPDAPTSPKRGAFVLAGLAAGFGLGLLIVALLEYRNTALRSERDVWAFTKLPTLATIGFFDDELEKAAIKGGTLVRFPRRSAKPVKAIDPKDPMVADRV
jgi:polysaccharide chain length determinant protein (PEP-CTERM system associated)